MCYVLIAFLILQEILHSLERRDLCNRLMSRNLSEYKGEKPKYAPSAHSRVLARWRERGDKEE